jgi:hypothetical protein
MEMLNPYADSMNPHPQYFFVQTSLTELRYRYWNHKLKYLINSSYSFVRVTVFFHFLQNYLAKYGTGMTWHFLL